jgi:hypothetical protein
MAAYGKTLKEWKSLVRKMKKRRGQAMELARRAVKIADAKLQQGETKLVKKEKEFKKLLKKEAAKTVQAVNKYGSQVSALEKKIVKIIQKNKLKI